MDKIIIKGARENNLKDISLELDNIEFKTSELDEKVDIKKEVRKT